MTPAELLKKYGVSTNPIPFDDVESETVAAAKVKLQKLIVAPTPKPQPVVVVKQPKVVVTNNKFSSTVKPKRKYTKRGMKTEEENIGIIPQRILDLFKAPPIPVYKLMFCVRFTTQMMATLFAQKHKDSELKTDTMSYSVMLSKYDNIQDIIKQAKSMDAIDYHLYKAVQ